MKVGDSIQHIFCKMRKEIILVTNTYLVCENKGYPSIIHKEQFDMWKVVPKIHDGLNEYVLERAFRKSATFTDFLSNLKEFEQDYKESSLP